LPRVGSGFAMWADEGARGVWLCGGTREKGRGTESLSDVWFLSMETLSWEKGEAGGGGKGPGPRSGVGCCVVGGKAMLFGGVTGNGKDGDEWHNDVCVFDMASKSWGDRRACKEISPRRSAGCCGASGAGGMLVLGGLREEGEGKKERELTLDDVWVVEFGGEGKGAPAKCLLKATDGGNWIEDDSSSDEEEN